jgi:hypothetical protein
MESNLKHFVKIDLPHYGHGTFYLDKVEGGFFQSLPLLVYFIMHDKGIFKELLTSKQFAALIKLIKKDKHSIYRIDESDPEFDEEKVEILKQLEYDSCAYVLYRLKLKAYNINQGFVEMFSIEEVGEKYFEANLSSKKFNENILKDVYLKLILFELNEIINGIADHSESDNSSLEEAIDKVKSKRDHLILYTDIPKRFHNNIDLLKAVINESVFELPEEVYKHKEALIHAMNIKLTEKGKYFKFDFDKLDNSLRDDFDVVHKSIQLNPLNLKYFSSRLKDSEQTAISALEKDGTALEYVSERLKQNKDIVSVAFKQNGHAFMFVADYFGDDEEMFLFAQQNLGMIFSSMLLDDEYVGILYFASDRLKDSEELVISAISSGASFKFVSPRLKNDMNFISNLFKTIHEKYKQKKDSHLQDYLNDEIEEFFDDELDDYFYESKSEIYLDILNCLDKSILKDKSFVLKLVSIDPIINDFIPKKYRAS